MLCGCGVIAPSRKGNGDRKGASGRGLGLDTEFIARIVAHLPSAKTFFEALGKLIYVGVALALYLAAMLAARARPSVVGYLKFIVPPSGWLTASAGVDICFYILRKLTFALRSGFYLVLKVAISSAGAALLVGAFGPSGAPPATALVLALCGLIYFCIGDFSDYWSHYAQHRFPFLWELHKVHHSATFMSPMTKYRLHPIEELYSNIIALTVFGVTLSVLRYAFGLTDVQVALMLLVIGLAQPLITLEPFRHSHIRVSYGPGDLVILSPTMHQLHHSAEPDHFNKNLGRYLSIWDRMFGTVQDVAPNQAITYGLGEGQDHHYRSPLNCLFLPLRNMADQTMVAARSAKQRLAAVAARSAETNTGLRP